MRALSLFSGIGGIDLAAQWAGIETVAFCEQNTFCQQVLAKHWPGRPIYDDVQTLTAARIRADGITSVDIVIGGPPCQGISNAGKRLGMADDRFLWPEFLGICGELRPRWIVAENPPAILTANKGKAFASILGTLVEMGYDATWGVWGACDVGAPHQRERLFLVAHLSGERRDPWGTVAGPRGQAYHHGAGLSMENPDIHRFPSEESHFTEGQCYQVGTAGLRQGRATMEDATECGLEEFSHSRLNTNQSDSSGKAQERGIPQSGVGLDAHGIPGELARHRWPAGPGTYQHPGEPPRIINERVSDHAERLKALGNAVVPQQIFPVFQAIMALEAGR